MTRKWRWGVNRWIALGLMVLGIAAAAAFPPIRPHIQLAPERLSEVPLVTLPLVGEIHLTNTLVALALTDFLLILMALAVRRSTKAGLHASRGIMGAVEALIETLYNLATSTAGRLGQKVFPLMATIVLMVLLANWAELIPGVDSIGILHHATEAQEGYPIREVGRIGEVQVMTLQGPEGEVGHGYTLLPFVRVLSTDLNFTISLGLIAVVMTQVYGIRSLGLSYFQKFFNFKALVSGSFLTSINFLVGFLELISELSKVLSFSIRLFANIFAGSVLLFVIGSLVPVFLPPIFLIFEFFVGLIQAFVFGMLTLVFISLATAGHASEGSSASAEGAEAHHAA